MCGKIHQEVGRKVNLIVLNFSEYAYQQRNIRMPGHACLSVLREFKPNDDIAGGRQPPGCGTSCG